MHSLLRWLWEGVKALGRRLRLVWEAVWNVLSSALTWIVGALAYVLDQLSEWINEAIQEGMEALSAGFGDVADTGSIDPVPLAQYILDLMAFDEAVAVLVEVFAFWLAARGARLLMVPVRALLELL